MFAIARIAAAAVLAVSSAAVGWSAGGTNGAANTAIDTAVKASLDAEADAGVSSHLFAVGEAGTVALSVDGDTLALVAVDARAGWAFEVTEKTDSSIAILFDNGEEQKEFSAEADAGQVSAEINGDPVHGSNCGSPVGTEGDDSAGTDEPAEDDAIGPDDDAPADGDTPGAENDSDGSDDETPQTKSVEVGLAGDVTFASDGQGRVSVLSVSPNPGWSFSITTHGNVQTVVFTDADGNVRTATGLFLAGNLIVDLSA